MCSDPVSNPEFFEGCVKDAQFRRMLFGLAFFHSILQVSGARGTLGNGKGNRGKHGCTLLSAR